jgi:OmpA-OmpF porin, OOP family
MLVRNKEWILAALGALTLVTVQPAWAVGDVKGSADHPMLTRFAGATIRGYSMQSYDEAQLPNQAIAEKTQVKFLTVEGKVTRISYRIDGSKSPFEVYRNYQAALQSGGFEIVFTCKNDEQCGREFQSYVILSGKLYESNGDAVFGGDYYAILAKKRSPAGDVYVFLDVMHDASNNLTPVFEQVVETKAMQQGQVKVLDASAMQKSLAESGKVAIYGVYFDTDKANIRSESKEELDQMAKLLRGNQSLKVYVVGHTDNAGTVARNQALSQERANAVVKALTSQYQIDPKRLAAYGVASLAPIASNDDETGKARNRRVELVKE